MFEPTQIASGTGLERGQALAEVSTAREQTRRWELGRGNESISDPVFGTGSLSALMVLLTPGNAARADPVEGSGAPLLQNRS